MELRVRVNEGQILTLLRREPRLQHRHWTEGPRRWLLVSESVQQCAEPTADDVEHTPDLAVLAMIRFNRYATQEVVDVVQIQVDDEPGADHGGSAKGRVDVRIQERFLDHQLAFPYRQSDDELCAGLDVFPNHP